MGAGRRCVAAAVVLVAAGGTACDDGRTELLVASTTSTEDSGLFDVLVPAFERAHPDIDLLVTAVGTGQALRLGRRGDADVLLVHAPAAESAFVAEGHGRIRCDVMYNDFVVVGPGSDPAGVAGSPDVGVALERIAGSGSTFTSRGDDSGTHRRELGLWEAAGVTPAGGWYQEVGQGMAEVLRMASESRSYTLTDRATFLNLRARLDLEILVEGDPRLFNQYGVIPVSGAANPEAARAFVRWITAPDAQAIIGRYGAERFGRPLFVPNAEPCDPPSPSAAVVGDAKRKGRGP
jgi:tungstate transport system substrate-binding protein